jgi:TPR repeat protein
MYEAGHGAAQDYAQAHTWYSMVVENSRGRGMRDMTKLNLDNLASRMTPDQIARAQEMARNFRPQ